MHYNLSRRKHIKKKSIPAAIRKIRRNQRLLSCCGFLLTTLWLVLQRLVPVQTPIIYQLLLVIILDGEQSKLKQLSFFFFTSYTKSCLCIQWFVQCFLCSLPQGFCDSYAFMYKEGFILTKLFYIFTCSEIVSRTELLLQVLSFFHQLSTHGAMM